MTELPRQQAHDGVTLRVEQVQKSRKKPAVAIYTRHSTSKQKSVPAQVDLCRSRAQERDWDTRFILKDEGESGVDDTRPGYLRLLDLVASQRIDVVIVWKVDRLARSLAQLAALEECLREQGVAIHSCTEPIDTTTSAGRFIFGMLASAAQLERDLIKERVKMGIAKCAQEGRWVSPVVPFGYRRTRGNKLRIHEQEAEIIRRVFDAYEEHTSCAQAAISLNERGIPARHGSWTASTVRHLMGKEIYCGHFKIGENHSFQKNLIIIDEERYRRIRVQMSKAILRGKPIANSAKEQAMDRIFGQYIESLKELGEENGVNQLVPV